METILRFITALVSCKALLNECLLRAKFKPRVGRNLITFFKVVPRNLIKAFYRIFPAPLNDQPFWGFRQEERARQLAQGPEHRHAQVKREPVLANLEVVKTNYHHACEVIPI